MNRTPNINNSIIIIPYNKFTPFRYEYIAIKLVKIVIRYKKIIVRFLEKPAVTVK